MASKNGNRNSNGHKPKRSAKRRTAGTKKTKTVRVDPALFNNAKQPRGRPFEKGNTVGFKTGESGNPVGRPKKRTLSEELRARLEEEYPDRPDATYGRMVAESLVDMAIKNGGAIAAISEIFDRVEGRPRQSVELKGDPEKAALIERAISALTERQNMSRDEAVEYLSTLKPEISQWIN